MPLTGIVILVSLLLLCISSALSSNTQKELCTPLHSPVTFKIPTFTQLSPKGNSNGLFGQATWTFNATTDGFTQANITFNACATSPETNHLIQYVERLRLVSSIQQTLVFNYTGDIDAVHYYNHTNTSTQCLNAHIVLPSPIPQINVTMFTTLGLIDDRGVVYSTYFINATEELVSSTPPPPPTYVILQV